MVTAEGDETRSQKTKLKVFCPTRIGQRPCLIVRVAKSVGQYQGGFDPKIVYPDFGTKLGQRALPIEQKLAATF